MSETLTAQITRAPRRRRLLPVAVAGLAAVLLAGPAALAQDASTTEASQPPTTRPGNPQTSTPFWGDPYGPPRNDRRDYDDRYDDDDSFTENFPVDLAGQVAPARERFMALKQGYNLARDRLNDRVDELRRAFQDSEEYRGLLEEREEIQRSMHLARRDALEPLRDDLEYQALVQLEQHLQARIREQHAAANPDMEAVRALSELAMEYARQRREMEQGLIGTDAQSDSSSQRLREIAIRQRELDEQFERDVRGNTELAQMRSDIDELRVAYLAAGAYYDSAVRTANIATEFAYFNSLARMGQNGYGYGYPHYGYPHGYPWWGGHHRGGLIIAGLPVLPPGSGPIRMRQIIRPTPVLSNTWRGGVYRPFVPSGNQPPPDFPDPD